MGSKLTLLLGLLVGAFLTLMCINENKIALSAKHNKKQISTAVTTNEINNTQTEKEIVVKLSEPNFSYRLEEKIVLKGNFSPDDKTKILDYFVENYCPDESCENSLTFDKNRKKADWQTDALKIAAFLKENNIKNGAISIDGQLFNIEGELKDEEEMKKLNTLLKPFELNQFKIENLTTVAQKEKEEIEQPQPPKEIKPQPTIQESQDKIDSILKANPVYFEFNSPNLTQKSKETLDKIVKIVKEFNNVALIVEGHTDSRGYASYNKALSQKRADRVKKYLLNHGLSDREIVSIGYGEERPITKNPRDEANRRVEIHLKKGE